VMLAKVDASFISMTLGQIFINRKQLQFGM